MRMAAGNGLTTPALMVNGFGCALLRTTQPVLERTLTGLTRPGHHAPGPPARRMTRTPDLPG